MRNSIVNNLELLAEKDPSIMFLVGGPRFWSNRRFSKKFSNQFINVGVAEQNLTGVATGLGLLGKKQLHTA